MYRMAEVRGFGLGRWATAALLLAFGCSTFLAHPVVHPGESSSRIVKKIYTRHTDHFRCVVVSADESMPSGVFQETPAAVIVTISSSSAPTGPRITRMLVRKVQCRHFGRCAVRSPRKSTNDQVFSTFRAQFPYRHQTAMQLKGLLSESFTPPGSDGRPRRKGTTTTVLSWRGAVMKIGDCATV